MLSRRKERVIELENYKVLSNGTLSAKATIKASAFSKAAEEKIKAAAGGIM